MIFIVTLSPIDSNEKLYLMLGNEHLQMVIKEINNSPNPQRLLNKAMTLPLFSEFAEECYFTVERKKCQKA